MNTWALKGVKTWSCTYCLASGPATEITTYIDGGRTPCCPRCQVDSMQMGEIELAERTREHRAGFNPESRLLDPDLGPEHRSTDDARAEAMAVAAPAVFAATESRAVGLASELASALFLSLVMAFEDAKLPPEAFVVRGRYRDVVGEDLRARGFSGLAVTAARILCDGGSIGDLQRPTGWYGQLLETFGQGKIWRPQGERE